MRRTRKNISQTKRSRVLVGISGGVDSSVAAILLKQHGYEVEGVFAKVWQPDFIECTWRDEMKDAMRVCARLDIPFRFLDLEKEYEQHVASYMIEEYKAGRTPNPDVMCNTHIKFGMMYDYAMTNGFDFVATGHYAQMRDGKLLRGSDSEKDQSYFLWNVPKERLQKVLFPVGELRKEDVRKVAARHDLFTAEKKDSQGLCFIGPVDMKDFLKHLIKTGPGDVLDSEGEKIGTHDGAQLYTVGERHGFVIDPKHKERFGNAQFVVGKNVTANAITVSDKPPKARRIVLTDINLVTDALPPTAQVQFRYRQKPVSVRITKEGGGVTLTPDMPCEFLAIGQSAVLYDGDVCIGGGIVDKVVY